MQLLVSVRSADEAVAALAGGADVIDAKEPARGSLGAVDADTLVAILRAVPPQHPISVALGDLTTPDQVRGAIASLPLPERPGPSFVKLGFAGVRETRSITELLDAAVRAASALPSRPGVIAVAYADARWTATPLSAALGVDAPDLQAVREAARDSGARGVLLDTSLKDGATLLDWLTLHEIEDWVTTARAEGLLTALAGSLDAQILKSLLRLSAEIIGVRGAACDGGRNGTVSSSRVATLARLLAQASQPSWSPLQVAFQ